MRRAQDAHARGRQLERELTFLDDDVVVAERLPLLEAHGGALYAANRSTTGISRLVRRRQSSYAGQ